MKTHTILPAIFLALCTVLSAEPAKLEVHEWGTFTIVSGSDGQPIRWYQPRKTLVELPAFVILQGQSINSNFSSGSNPPSETVYVMTPRMNNGGSINGTNLVDQYAEGPLGLKSGWYTGATTKSDDTKILSTTTQDAAELPALALPNERIRPRSVPGFVVAGKTGTTNWPGRTATRPVWQGFFVRME